MLKKVFSILFIISLSCLMGCTAVSNEKIDEVIEEDPSFKQVLDEKQLIDAEIASLEESLRGKKKSIQSKISALRKEFKEEKVKLISEIKRLKHKLDPQKDLVRTERNVLKSEVKEKEVAFRNVEKTIEDLQKLVSKEETLDISKEEIARWHQRIKLLEGDEKSIKKELKELKERLEVLEIKLKALK